MDFHIQFKIRFIASLVGFFTTIGLILAGASYYALALGQTAMATVSFAMFCSIKPKGMVWLPRLRGIGEVASFGVFTSLANFFRKLVVTMPDMVIGKMGTTAQVGMFSRSLGFITFVSKTIVTGVKPVALPYLSSVRRSGGDITDAYTRASVMLGGITWPLLAVASVVSLPAIRLFFGDQWDAAAAPASMLAYWVMLRTLHIFSGDLFTALHREKILALKEGLLFFLYFGAIVLAFPNGLLAIANMFVIVSAVDLLVTTAMLVRYAGLKPSFFFRAWLKNGFLTILCWGAAWQVYTTVTVESGSVMTAFIMVALALPVVWILGIFILAHPLRAELTGIVKVLREKLWRGSR